MRTDLLKSLPLTHCLTEDIDLSYSLFMRGLKVVANPYSGSREETSPDLYSFLARRRRWASSHATAFFLNTFRYCLRPPFAGAIGFSFFYMARII